MSRRKKTLEEIANQAAERRVCCFFGQDWRDSISAEAIYEHALGYYHGYLAGRRAERRAAAKRRAG